MKHWFLTGLVAGAMLACMIWLPVASAQSPTPLFVVGHEYGLIYNCLAEIGCYGEIVVVNAVRPDGWIEITAEDGRHWTVNTANMLSFMPASRRPQPTGPKV